MDELIKFLLNKLENYKSKDLLLKSFILISVFLFIISVVILFVLSKETYASTLLQVSMFMWAIAFIMFIIIQASEWKKEEKIKFFNKIEKLLVDLQRIFENQIKESFKQLKLTNIDNKQIFRKTIFELNDYLHIVCTIDDENLFIRNFFIRSWKKEHLNKIKEYKKENISINERRHRWYNDEQIIYSETIELCEQWKYAEAVQFLMDIINNTLEKNISN